MRRHLLAVLALAVIGGLGLFTGGCSSGCGHCEDPCYDDAACHDGCAEVACDPCGRCLDTWYQCPCCGTSSAYDGCCTHCGAPLEVRHAGCATSPEGCEGPRSGGYGWQIELARAERGCAKAQVANAPAPQPKACNCPDCAKKAAVAKTCGCADCTRKAAAAAPKRRDCPECAKRAAPAKHDGCAECAKKAAQPPRRTVVREQPAPKPTSSLASPVAAKKTGAKVAAGG